MEQLKDITKEISNEIYKHNNNYRSSAASTPYNQESDMSISVNKSKHNYSALNHSEYVPEKSKRGGTPKQEKALIPAKVAFSNLLNKVNAINFVSQRDIRELENDPELESIIRGSASNRKSPNGSSSKRNKSARGDKMVSPGSYKKIHEDQVHYKLEGNMRKKLEFFDEKPEKKESRPHSIENKAQKANMSFEKKTIFEIPSSMVQGNKYFKDDDKFFKQRDSVKEVPAETIPPKVTLNPPQSYKSNNYESKKAPEAPSTSNPTEKIDSNLIIELKNRIHAKELEIIDLKNSRLQNDMENQNLLLQIKDQLTDNKRNEELIEKLRQQCAMQEKEIDILRVSLIIPS